ncbi:MAG: hypothetical protein WCA84_16385 [Ignavibacteriaceae bacterium]
MFEKEIKFISDFHLNKVKSFGSFISFERMLNSSMHPAVIQYISAELDYLISVDRKRLLRESVFDYSGPETVKYFALIAQEVKKSKEISFEDLKQLVVQAVSFNLNFLVRPKWSLSKLIYNEEQERSIEEIRLNLNYIYFYDYIKSIFLSYISKRKLSGLSVTEFELILNKIDNELFSAQPQKLVDHALFSMTEFFNPGEIDKTQLSAYSLELFLKEKNLGDYLSRLRKAVPEDSGRKYDVEDLKNIIYSSVSIDEFPLKPLEEIPENEAQRKDDEIIQKDEEKEILLPFGEEEEKSQPSFPVEDNTGGETVEEEPEEKIDGEISFQKINEGITEQESLDELLKINFEEEIQQVESIEEISVESVDQELIEEKPEEVFPPAEELELPVIHEPVVEAPFIEESVVEEPVPEEPVLEEQPVEENKISEEPQPAEGIKEEVNPAGAPAPDEEIKSEDIDTGVLADEDFFSLFTEEMKRVEENDADLKHDADEINSEAGKKDEFDSFLDFEEETENLLRAFKETEDELNSKDIGLFQDSDSVTEKAAMDLIKDFHDENEIKDTPVPPAKEVDTAKPVKKNGKNKDKKTRNILDSISNNDVEKIIFNVFNDDREDFSTTIEKLNECANYDEATEILKSVFLTYRVNPYTKDALTLTNSVANYFTRD